MLLYFTSVFSSIMKFVRKFKNISNDKLELHGNSLTINDNLPADQIVQFDYYLERFALIHHSSMKSIFNYDNESTCESQYELTSNWKFYNFFIKFNSFFMLTTFIIKLFLIEYGVSHEQTEYWLWVFGDVFLFFNGKKYFYNVIMTIYGIQSCLMIILFMNEQGVNEWMRNFGSLQGLVSPKSNGIYNMKSIDKLIHKFKMTFIISSFQSYIIPIIGYPVAVKVSIENVTWKQYFMTWMFWNVYFYLIWAYFTPGIIQTCRSYFNLVCYYYKLRLQDLDKEIVKIIKISSANTSNHRLRLLIQNSKINFILHETNKIFVSLAKSNEFWCKYTAVFYYLYNPLICFILSCLIYFITDYRLFLFATILLISAFFTLINIIITASDINYQAKLCGKNLIKLLYLKSIPQKYKLKVRLNLIL